MEAEKPVALLEEIIGYISLPNELLLDQFGGSGNFAIAYLNMNRNGIIIEKDPSIFNKMKDNINNTMNIKNDYKVTIQKIESDEDKDMEMELM